MKPKLLLEFILFLLLINANLFVIAQPHYNVLFIAVDDMNDRCSLFGNMEVASPSLQRLASHGMVFTHAYTQFPLCNPSRTSLLTGWRPDKTTIKSDNVRPRSVLGPDVVFLPEYFRQNGYHTERYGKILQSVFENDISWDYAEPPEQNDGSGFNLRVSGNEDVAPGWWVKDVNDTLFEDGKIAQHLIASLQQPHGQSFFYGLGFIGTHLLFTPNLEYWNMNGDPAVQQLLKTDIYGNYGGLKGNGSSVIQLPNTSPGDRNDVPLIALPPPIVYADTEWRNMIHAYDAEVSMLDAQLGLVLDEMDQQQLWSNTVVVFWSDHGQHLGEHEGCWGKGTLFEESLHVPLIVCVPGKKTGICTRLIELVDLYPTLAELCGLQIPPGMEGSSFAPLLDKPGFRWKPAVFSQVSHTPNDLGRSITTDLNRYNNWGVYGEELYEHNIDPKEYDNLIDNPADSALANKMRNLMAKGWTAALPPVYKKSVWYRDADNDGYGSATDSIVAYWNVKGYVSDNRDCNDLDVKFHPGAIEICDGKDNNCNGLVDETCIIGLSVDNESFLEGNSGIKKIFFRVSLSQAGTTTVEVLFSTADSTAIAGSDYTRVSGTVIFQPGQIRKSVGVPVIGDLIPEQKEIFKVILSGPVNAALTNGIALGIIRNDDSITNIFLNKNEAGSLKSLAHKDDSVEIVWPNPAANILNIRLPSSMTKANIELVNTKGTIVKKWLSLSSLYSQPIKLYVNSIPKGEYFLLINDDAGNRQVKKIIILH